MYNVKKIDTYVLVFSYSLFYLFYKYNITVDSVIITFSDFIHQSDIVNKKKLNY